MLSCKVLIDNDNRTETPLTEQRHVSDFGCKDSMFLMMMTDVNEVRWVTRALAEHCGSFPKLAEHIKQTESAANSSHCHQKYSARCVFSLPGVDQAWSLRSLADGCLVVCIDANEFTITVAGIRTPQAVHASRVDNHRQSGDHEVAENDLNEGLGC